MSRRVDEFGIPTEETRMDEEITRKSEPPQPPDFDPPDGYQRCPSSIYDRLAKAHTQCTLPSGHTGVHCDGVLSWGNTESPEERLCPDDRCERNGGRHPHPADTATGGPGDADRERAITLLMAGYEKTGMQSLFDERACAYTVDAWICAMRAAMAGHGSELEEYRLKLSDRGMTIQNQHAEIERLRAALIESGSAHENVGQRIEHHERAIRSALGATDDETTLAAARRVVAARDVAREANRTVGDDAYRRGIVIGLAQAQDIVTDSTGDTLGRLEALQRIRDARDRARKRRPE